MKFKPHDYQRRCIQFIIDHPEAGLFLDMGLGKTVITLTAVRYLLYDSFEVSKVLVIAPLRVAEDTWTREAEKWDHLKDLRISRILGSAKERELAAAADADIYVTNRENVVWLVRNLKKWPFDMIVIDELSSFKSPQSQRFKALRKVRLFASRVVGLTGTPAANGLMDLWAEIGILDGGKRLGRFITRYREEYFRPGWVSPQGIVYKYEPKPDAMRRITEKISDITISLKAADYLQLPDEIESIVEVAMPEKAKREYDIMERDAVLELEEAEITALNAAAVLTKLTQIADGFAYDSAGKAVRIHDAKTEALKEIIEQADSPVLVFYQYREDAEHLMEAVPGARPLHTESDIKAWNDGKIPVLLTHPASAGYGLNLQDGGHVIVWYGLTWSLEQYLQANARLHRQGQTKPVLVYRLLAKDTVDEEILRRLDKKSATQDAVLAILKDRKKHLEERSMT